MDTAKRDLVLAYGGRTFAVRAYRDASGDGGPGWRSIIIENRTPLMHEQAPAVGPAACFAEAVRFLTGAVEAQADAAALRPPPTVVRNASFPATEVARVRRGVGFGAFEEQEGDTR